MGAGVAAVFSPVDHRGRRSKDRVHETRRDDAEGKEGRESDSPEDSSATIGLQRRSLAVRGGQPSRESPTSRQKGALVNHMHQT